MKLKHISWELIFYLALVEAFSLWMQEIMWLFIPIINEPLSAIFYGITTGFLGMFLTISVYNLMPLKIKINKIEIKKAHVLVPSLLNALFLAFAFLIQIKIMQLEKFGLVGYAVLGFISIAFAAALSIFIYNSTEFRIKFYLNDKIKTIKKINYWFALFAGFFEFFIIPLMFIFYANNMPSLLNGFLSGALGSLLPFFTANLLLKKLDIQIKI